MAGGGPLRLTPDGRIAFTFHNVADRPLRWTGRIHLEDAFGRMAEVPFDVTVEAGSFVHVPLADRLPAKGWWRARAEIHGTDKSTADCSLRAWFADEPDGFPEIPNGE